MVCLTFAATAHGFLRVPSSLSNSMDKLFTNFHGWSTVSVVFSRERDDLWPEVISSNTMTSIKVNILFYSGWCTVHLLEIVARKKYSVDLTLRGLRSQCCLLLAVKYQSIQSWQRVTWTQVYLTRLNENMTPEHADGQHRYLMVLFNWYAHLIIRVITRKVNHHPLQSSSLTLLKYRHDSSREQTTQGH